MRAVVFWQTAEYWATAGPLYAAAVATIIAAWRAGSVAKHTTSWTVSAQLHTQEIQRQMAADERVFEQRASAYIEALTMLHDMIRAWDSGSVNTKDGVQEFQSSYGVQPPSELLARLSAFCSDATETFRTGYRAAYDAAAGPITAADVLEATPDTTDPIDLDRLEILHTHSARAVKAYEQLSDLAARDLQRP